VRRSRSISENTPGITSPPSRSLASTTRDKLALRQQVVCAEVTYLAVVLIVAALLQAFTPFPVLTWLARRQNAAAGLSR
jgi:hypothetical protein